MSRFRECWMVTGNRTLGTRAVNKPSLSFTVPAIIIDRGLVSKDSPLKYKPYPVTVKLREGSLTALLRTE